MKIGFFGIESAFQQGQHDRAYLPKLAEMIGGGHSIKVSVSEDGIEYLAAFAAKIKAADLDAVICTDQKLMTAILKSLPDFKQGYNKNGSEKRLSQNDYHGSFVNVAGFRLGRDRDLDVLFLNPLQHLRTVPEAPYIFRRFISKITSPGSWFPQTDFTWEVANEDTVADLYERFRAALLIAVDTETDEGSDLRTINCSGYCALFADGSTHSVVIPTITWWGVQWMRQFNSLPAAKIFQNGGYDNLYFLRYGSPVYNWQYDTQHLFHSWYSELPKRLDYITAFSIRRVRFWKDDGKVGGLLGHYEYNARDCWATLNTCLSLLLEMPDWAYRNYIEHEFPLVFPCLHVEADGIPVDKEAFLVAKASVQAELAPLLHQLTKWFGPKFNARSPVQVKNLLKVLGCADKFGNVESSDEHALNAAAALHPLNERILSVILEVRGLLKLDSTYLVWEKFWNDRLYCKFNPAGTDTGRLNCAESGFWCGLSMQTIPVRDGPVIRQFIKSDPGWNLGENDMPQAEARGVGYMSGCTTLIDLVEGPHDYHSWNASKFFGLPYETIYNDETKEKLNKPIRELSKRTNHGANYNMMAGMLLETMGPKNVAMAKSLLNLPAKWTLLEVCKYLLDQYDKTYPEIRGEFYDYIKRCIKLTHKMVSPMGWTRYFFIDPLRSKPELNSAVAHPSQNLNAGICNKGFYRVWRESVYGSLRGLARLKAPIHDSILYGYTGKETPQMIKELMILPVDVTDIKGKTRNMVIYPDVSVGKNGNATYWSELK